MASSFGFWIEDIITMNKTFLYVLKVSKEEIFWANAHLPTIKSKLVQFVSKHVCPSLSKHVFKSQHMARTFGLFLALKTIKKQCIVRCVLGNTKKLKVFQKIPTWSLRRVRLNIPLGLGKVLGWSDGGRGSPAGEGLVAISERRLGWSGRRGRRWDWLGCFGSWSLKVES